MGGLLRGHLGLAIVVCVLSCASHGDGGAEAAAGTGTGAHHVVGGDPGWGSAANLASWSIGKLFRVGDTIWFAYSGAEESIAELRTRGEFESCELGNPIRMYTEGLTRVTLDAPGSRFFVSTNADKCENGLRLHLHVLPPPPPSPAVVAVAVAAADGPSPSPTSSAYSLLQGLTSTPMWVALALLLFTV